MPPHPATLHLCFGDAREDLLSHHQVFAEERFALADGSAKLYVIGASSIVLVEVGSVRLAEIIACGPSRYGFGAFSEAGVSLAPGCGGSVDHQTRFCSYWGEIRTLPIGGDMPDGGDAVHRVSYRFPSAGRPLTRIEAAEVEPGSLKVQTWHEYPEWGISVESRSRWSFNARP